MFFQALVLAFALEAGAVSGTLIEYTPDPAAPRWTLVSVPLYLTLEAEAEIHGVFLGGFVRTDMLAMREPLSGDPFQMTYGAAAGYRKGPVEIGWRHVCTHPIDTYAAILRDDIRPKHEGFFDQLYIRISSRR